MSALPPLRILLAALLGMLLFAPAAGLPAASSREDVARVVQLLGYGGAIHHFKNYVLRGDNRPEYGSQAREDFNAVLALVARLENSPDSSDRDRQALAGIKQTVNGYLDGLRRIGELFEKGWRLEDIDRVVIVDDRPALLGLQQLRSKWQWSEWEQVEHLLGYGGAIHHFKNYVLRHSDVYYTQALENFLAVESVLADLASRENLTQDQTASLAAIERMSHTYMEYLPLIERLIRAQRPIRQIDLAVKVNDRPALAAFDKLRGR